MRYENGHKQNSLRIFIRDPKVLENRQTNLTIDVKEMPVMLMVYVLVDRQLKNTYDILKPAKETHPVVYDLIAKSLQLYRQDHQNSFLDKKYVPY